MIDGGAGYDVVHVQGHVADYKITNINGVIYIDSVSAASSSIQETQLINAEKIQFDDQSVDLTASMKWVNHPGGEHFTGGAGIDQVSYELNRVSYEVSKSAKLFVVTDNVGDGGVDLLSSIERLNFKDVKVALDLDGHAGDVVKIIGAVFGASALKQHPEYIGIGLGYRDAGMSPTPLMSLALKAANLNLPETLVSQLWLNVMHQVGAQSDLQRFVQMLSEGMPPEDLAMLAANSDQNASSINLVGLSNTGVVFV